MAKIDDIIEQLGAGYQNPSVSFGPVMVEDQYMEQIKLRRKQAGLAQHKVCVLSISEMGQPGATFYGHKLSDCIKKALEWRGLPTKMKRGHKDNGQPEAQG